MLKNILSIVFTISVLQLFAQEEIVRKDGTVILVFPDGSWQPKLDNGTLRDGRDGQTYKTITIGKQVWMAENLNYQLPNSWVFDNDSKPEPAYGRLYTWDAAQRACPSGWHLPGDNEWQTLMGNLGGKMIAGKKMKAASEDWKTNVPEKTEVIGFNALPAGSRLGYNESFEYKGVFGFFWSSTEFDSKTALRYYCFYGLDDLIRIQYDKNTAISVRCVKD
jgi:uncharacterized protein (TIGR02145 family)